MKRPADFEEDYPFFPLNDEERNTREPGRAWAHLLRFPKRITAAKIQDYYPRPVTDLSEHIFYRGGKLSDHGYYVREELDVQEVYDVLQAILYSPYPNYQQREAALTLAWNNWFTTTKPEIVRDEPVLVTGFFRPGTRGLDDTVLTGLNRN